jgi:hypothetical protein
LRAVCAGVAREDKCLARAVESVRVELEDEQRRLALARPRFYQPWYREQYEREEIVRRLRVAGLEDALDKALEKRRLHGWPGS